MTYPTKEEIQRLAEELTVEVLIGLLSERSSYVSIEWSDGSCRVQLGRETQRRKPLGIGVGPNFQKAAARAMLDYDEKGHWGEEDAEEGS